MIESIYIISNDKGKTLELSNIINNIDSNYSIASTFTTNNDSDEKYLSENYMYYISEDQLNLDFRNNALLYVITDSNTQESIGIAVDELYNNKLIPMTIKAFNTVNTKYINNCLIVWIDSIMNKLELSLIDYQLNMIETKYLMKNLDKYKDNMLYFNSKEDLNDCANIILEYMNGDENRRQQLLEENS